MDKEYKQDKKYWIRMSADLRIASTLITRILCDHDYNYMMPKVIWEKLATADRILGRVKSEAEIRMFRMTPFRDEDVFYPGYSDKINPKQLVEEFRQKVREAADGET